MIKVLFVCHGNICRSTMAQSVFAHMVKERGLEELFYIDSAATSREEIGNGPHYGTVNQLRKVNIPVIPHRAVQMTKSDYEKYDYLIGMDTANIRNMNRIADGDPEGRFINCFPLKTTKPQGNWQRDMTWRIRGTREILRRRTGMWWQDVRDC